MTSEARIGFGRMLNYAGGAYIYVREKYSQRIKVLHTSWATANNRRLDVDEEPELSAVEQSTWSAERVAEINKSLEQQSFDKKQSPRGKDEVPTTYPAMFQFNAAVMGLSGITTSWMHEVLQSFDAIVFNVANSYRLQEECDILSLRLAKFKPQSIKLGQYRPVMLASLRALVQKDWDSKHEESWNWLWENCERMLLAQMGKPAVMQAELQPFEDSMDETLRRNLRRQVYATFFATTPAGQDFFKQSTTRLHFIADKILEMVLAIFKDPNRMSEEISALGLRHVGYAVPTDLFGPFVSAFINVVRELTMNEALANSFSWSLGLISRMLVRTILEGSTVVMKAINGNSKKQIKMAAGLAPRAKRTKWMLNVTVGTQSISPLMWSIESGAVEASSAILNDLLTIRADRDRYYFGADDLFNRHPDLVARICETAPMLLPVVLDNLMWRSRLSEKGLRRVNYYIKYLLIDNDGNFNKALSHIFALHDPKVVCHPLLMTLKDILWNGPVHIAFVWQKCGL